MKRFALIVAALALAGCDEASSIHVSFGSPSPTPPQTISGKWEHQTRSTNGQELISSYEFQSNGRVRCKNSMVSSEGARVTVNSNDGWYAVSEKKISVTPTWGSPSFTMSIEPNGDLILFTQADDDSIGTRLHPAR